MGVCSYCGLKAQRGVSFCVSADVSQVEFKQRLLPLWYWHVLELNNSQSIHVIFFGEIFSKFSSHLQVLTEVRIREMI